MSSGATTVRTRSITPTNSLKSQSSQSSTVNSTTMSPPQINQTNTQSNNGLAITPPSTRRNHSNSTGTNRSSTISRSSPLSSSTARPPKLKMDTLSDNSNSNGMNVNNNIITNIHDNNSNSNNNDNSNYIHSTNDNNDNNYNLKSSNFNNQFSIENFQNDSNGDIINSVTAVAAEHMFNNNNNGNIAQRVLRTQGIQSASILSAGLSPANLFYGNAPLSPRTRQQLDYNRTMSVMNSSSLQNNGNNGLSSINTSNLNNSNINSAPISANSSIGEDGKKLNLYKTELCRSWEETGTCRYSNKCQFAHSLGELRRVDRHPKYKTEMCKTYWERGSCPYGKRCCFIHKENTARLNGNRNSSPQRLLNMNGTTPPLSSGLDSAFILRTPVEPPSPTPLLLNKSSSSSLTSQFHTSINSNNNSNGNEDFNNEDLELINSDQDLLMNGKMKLLPRLAIASNSNNSILSAPLLNNHNNGPLSSNSSILHSVVEEDLMNTKSFNAMFGSLSIHNSNEEIDEDNFDININDYNDDNNNNSENNNEYSRGRTINNNTFYNDNNINNNTKKSVSPPGLMISSSSPLISSIPISTNSASNNWASQIQLSPSKSPFSRFNQLQYNNQLMMNQTSNCSSPTPSIVSSINSPSSNIHHGVNLGFSTNTNSFAQSSQNLNYKSPF